MNIKDILKTLKSIFYTKAETDNKYVNLTTNQTINGNKTFNNAIMSNSIVLAYGEGSNHQFVIHGGKGWDLGSRVMLNSIDSDNGAYASIQTFGKSSDNTQSSSNSYMCDNSNFYPYFQANLGTSTNKWKTINGLEPSQLSLPKGSNCITITPSYTVGEYITMTASGFLRIQAENTDYELVMNNGDGTVVCSISKLGCRLMIVPVVKGQRFKVTKCEGAYGVYLRLLPSQGNI